MPRFPRAKKKLYGWQAPELPSSTKIPFCLKFRHRAYGGATRPVNVRSCYYSHCPQTVAPHSGQIEKCLEADHVASVGPQHPLCRQRVAFFFNERQYPTYVRRATERESDSHRNIVIVLIGVYLCKIRLVI